MNGYLRRSKDQPWERKRGNKSCKKDCNKVNKGNLKRDNVLKELNFIDFKAAGRENDSKSLSCTGQNTNNMCNSTNHFILDVFIYFISFVSYIFDYPPCYYSKMFHVISWGIKL